MRVDPRSFLAIAILVFVSTNANQAMGKNQPFTHIEYQGKRFEVAREYRNFNAYRDDPENLTQGQAVHVEKIMREVKFGPSFKDFSHLFDALRNLQFPGYGSFYANQADANMESALELAYVEIPIRNLNRYFALEVRRDGSFQVIDDFIAPSLPEITRVQRGSNGALEYRNQHGSTIVPLRQ
jgi:hypothetical protein